MVRAETLKFKEEGVRAVVRDVLLPWFNAYRFFIQSAEILLKDNGVSFSYDPRKPIVSENAMDRWILASCQTLIQFVREEMSSKCFSPCFLATAF